MVVAYHVIWGCYGFWLPNDPRGSWSDFVRSYELRAFGPATKTNTRRSVAGTGHDAQARRDAKSALRHEPMRLTGAMAQTTASAFGTTGLVMRALAVMPDHVHVVLPRGPYRVEQQVRRLKQAATTALRREELVVPDRPVWARGCWKVFLNDAKALQRAVDYVNHNPVQAGLRRQRWSCVSPGEDGSSQSIFNAQVERAIKDRRVG